MKVMSLVLALAWGGSAFAGGAIGGSTGAKCAEYIVLKPVEFQRLLEKAMSQREMMFRGEAMEVEAVDWDVQMIQMRSMEHRERSIIWYVEIQDLGD